MGGNAAFNAAGATIVAPENVFLKVSEDQQMSIAGQARNVPASVPEAWPIITFGTERTFRLNGQTLRVFHFPAAHTDGDAVVVFEKVRGVTDSGTRFDL